MNYLYKYTDLCGCENQREVFNYFCKTLSTTHYTWKYFVDWDKIKEKVDSYKAELSLLSALCGSKNITQEFCQILSKYPQVTQCLPTLLALRGQQVSVVTYTDNRSKYNDFDFTASLSDFTSKEEFINHYINFMEQSGLFAFIENTHLSSLKDYAYGVEVGLDTNGRKNRSGQINHHHVHRAISQTCIALNLVIEKEISTQSIKEKYNISITGAKTKRRYDFTLYHQETKTLIIIETNYYSKSGSKIKTTCGEYTALETALKGNDVYFIWITDGQGLLTAKNPLADAFAANDYIINHNMISIGIFEEILNNIIDEQRQPS